MLFLFWKQDMYKTIEKSIFFCMYIKGGYSKRFWFVVSDSLKEHFSCHKWIYFILIVAAILGLLIGFVSASARMDDVALKDLPDVVLLKFVNKTISPLSFFFSRLFSFLGLFLLIYACGSVRFLCFVPFLLITYRAVFLAVNCSILVHLYKLGGILDVVLIFFPIHFLLLLTLLVWSCVCIRQSFVCKHTGVSVFSNRFLCEHKTCILFCLFVSFCLILIESLLLSSFSTIIFVGVS